MFEVGFTEIILILGLALLVLGPEKLPGLAEKVGRWTGRARAMARQLRTQLEQEVTMEEMAKSRPMQAPRPAQTADETPAQTAAAAPESPPAAATSAPPESAPSEPAPHAGPGLDLDRMVSGIEPQQPAASPEPETAKTPQ